MFRSLYSKVSKVSKVSRVSRVSRISKKTKSFRSFRSKRSSCNIRNRRFISTRVVHNGKNKKYESMARSDEVQDMINRSKKILCDIDSDNYTKNDQVGVFLVTTKGEPSLNFTEDDVKNSNPNFDGQVIIILDKY